MVPKKPKPFGDVDSLNFLPKNFPLVKMEVKDELKEEEEQ